MSPDWAIFADFDGTLTDHDTIDLIGEHYLGPDYGRAMARRFRNGELTVRGWLDDEFARLAASPEELAAFLLPRVTVDPALGALLAYARGNAIPFTVLSSGVEEFIRPLLAAAGCAIETRCNRLGWEAGRLRVEYRDDSDNGHDKAAALRAARAAGRRVVYLGDGITDLECAGEADALFVRGARGELARHCRRRGIPFHRFEGCGDVLGWLQSGSFVLEEIQI